MNTSTFVIIHITKKSCLSVSITNVATLQNNKLKI